MDEQYMKRALNLALKGEGYVSPNPLVGAVIVKAGKIIGEGYHQKCGEAHAEVNAINSATEEIEGATIYVTLEPCSHYGRTPPCADKIIENKIARVVIGTVDPNPLVAGKGIEKLQKAGIEVKVGVLEKECININEIFMKFISTKTPYVLMKSAMSLDGKIATSSGESKWITSEEARNRVHQLRHKYSGIMVGINTVIKDNPELTCRITSGVSPIRIIVDSKLRIPVDSKIVSSAYQTRTIVATTNKSNERDRKKLEESKVEVLVVKDKAGKVDLKDLMVRLGEMKIDSILLEGGGNLNYSALEAGIVDEVQMYISPKIIGGENSKSPVEGNGIEFLKDAFKLEKINCSFVGEDILIEGEVKKCLQE